MVVQYYIWDPNLTKEVTTHTACSRFPIKSIEVMKYQVRVLRGLPNF